MKLKEYLEEAEVISFKSKRIEDLENEVDQVAVVIMKYLVGLSLLEKRLGKKDSPANAAILDIINFHISDISNFIKVNWPVSYKGLKKSKLTLFRKKK